MIAIVDYGVGNLRSVARALEKVGGSPGLCSSHEELRRANGVVLPGVGAFAPALRRLQDSGLGRSLVEIAARGTPLLGVCLGYQLLYEQSLEMGQHAGLGLLRGRVERIEDTEHLPVIGWCRVRQEAESPLFAGIAQDAYFYFVHSYTPTLGPDRIASAPHTAAAAGGRGRVLGTQFHPELSGADGLRLYANFLDVCGAG